MATRGNTVEETTRETFKQEAGDTSHLPLFHVVLLNDDLHTYDYIVEMLGRLFLHSPAKAFHHAVEVDTTGRSIVITCELAQAEYARDQILGYGRDRRVRSCLGSMTAIVEPAGAGA